MISFPAFLVLAIFVFIYIVVCAVLEYNYRDSFNITLWANLILFIVSGLIIVGSLSFLSSNMAVILTFSFTALILGAIFSLVILFIFKIIHLYQ